MITRIYDKSEDVSATILAIVMLGGVFVAFPLLLIYIAIWPPEFIATFDLPHWLPVLWRVMFCLIGVSIPFVMIGKASKI
jgi:hypothetical protein